RTAQPAKTPANDNEKTTSKDDAKTPAKDETKTPGKDGAKRQPEPPKADSKPGTDADKPKPKSEKITWSEQRKWRDGAPASLPGGNGAYYLTRNIISTRPRRATVQIDGPAGFKLWVNGELVHSSAPPPPQTSSPPAPPKKEMKADDDEAAGPDPEAIDLDAMMGRTRSKTEQ